MNDFRLLIAEKLLGLAVSIAPKKTLDGQGLIYMVGVYMKEAKRKLEDKEG